MFYTSTVTVLCSLGNETETYALYLTTQIMYYTLSFYYRYAEILMGRGFSLDPVISNIVNCKLSIIFLIILGKQYVFVTHVCISYRLRINLYFFVCVAALYCEKIAHVEYTVCHYNRLG